MNSKVKQEERAKQKKYTIQHAIEELDKQIESIEKNKERLLKELKEVD